MCSDDRAILNPTDEEVGNLIRLEVSSLMAWHGFLGSAGSEALSHSWWWVMVVSGCWKRIMSEGPVRSVHPQLGEQGFPLTRPELCVFLGEGSEGAGHRRVNVQKWQLVKLYCPDTFSHICKTSRGHYVWPKKTLTLNVSTPVCGKRSFLHKRCARLSISQHACVFFFLWLGISFYWMVIMDPDGFPVDIRKVVTHGSWWVTSPPVVRAHKLTNHEAMQFFTMSHLLLGEGCVIIPKAIMHAGLLHRNPSLCHTPCWILNKM